MEATILYSHMGIKGFGALFKGGNLHGSDHFVHSHGNEWFLVGIN